MKHFQLQATAATTCAVLALCLGGPGAQDITFKGGATVGIGEIMQSSDTTSMHYSGNRIQNISAKFGMDARFGDNLLVSTGMGIVDRHYPSGRLNESGGRIPFIWTPFMVDASFKYTAWKTEDNGLALTGGYFPYSYNPDVKDLGLYLLRGPVYPGVLISGYDSKYTSPNSNMAGFRIQHTSGPFEQNLILGTEIENFPLFDFSPAYIANVNIGKGLRLGAGVNLYHWIPIESKLTNPDTFAYNGSDFTNYTGDPNSRTWIYIDSLAKDTTFMSFKGTKVMADFSFDPKAFFDATAFGPDDLKLYGEVAMIGLDYSKPYKALYGGMSERIPVMVGFNFPVFNLLDHLSLEVEWYGSKVKDDLARLQSTSGAWQSPIPVPNRNDLNLKRDDWKWAFHAAKTFGHLQLLAQVANDHSRSSGTQTAPGSEWETYFITPTDWYWIGRIGFFF